MKPQSITSPVLCVCVSLLGFTAAFAQETNFNAASLRAKALESFAPLPDKMPGSEKDTAALIALGKGLYFEKSLSRNGSQSCATCHPFAGGRAGADNMPTSLGALGKPGARNSPTVLNAGFHFVQFWDGRAENVKEQAKGPLLNPVEMAMPNQAAAVERVQSDKNYRREFADVFRGQPEPITFDNILEAIAAFERTLITHDRFDDFLKGRDSALTPSEAKGLDTFLTIGCTTCHNGPLLGGNSFRKLGIVKPYTNQTDHGRGAIVKSDDDFDWDFQFKVPSLRNIAATAPYFHDGSAATLSEAIHTMASLQLGIELSKEQEQELITFLQCLTGKGIASRPSVQSETTLSAAKESQ